MRENSGAVLNILRSDWPPNGTCFPDQQVVNSSLFELLPSPWPFRPVSDVSVRTRSCSKQPQPSSTEGILSLSCFDVPPSVTIYTATTCCLESASLPCCTDPNCTQAYKQGPGPRRCPPYRQEPKVPPVEMSLFPLGCHTMSATLWSQLKARRTEAFAHSRHSTAKALTLTRSY